jgi:WD repeat-containing protein 48
VLRYLFSNLIDEEVKRDVAFRETLLKERSVDRAGRPTNIKIPQAYMNGWNDTVSGPTSGSTIRASNGFHLPVMTPGLAIGLATPGLPTPSIGQASHHNALTPTTEEGTQLEKTQTQRSSTQDQPDYFSRTLTNNGKPRISTEGSTGSAADNNAPQSPADDTPADKKKGKNLFSKKKFNMNFNMKKFTTSSSTHEAPTKPAAVDEKTEDSDSRSNKTDEKIHEDNFFGAISKIRQSYEEQLVAGAQRVESQVTPSMSNETPVLRPPASTTIIIQEDRPGAGGMADLFEGKVGSLGQQADLIEKCAPVWLADLLLKVCRLLSSFFLLFFRSWGSVGRILLTVTESNSCQGDC